METMDVSILVAELVLLVAIVAGGYVVVTKVVVREVPDSQRAACSAEVLS